MAVVALWWPESKKACGGSGENETPIAAAPGAPRSPSSSSWHGRRCCVEGTRSRGSSPVLATGSHDGEKRRLSGEKGIPCGVRERRWREGNGANVLQGVSRRD